MNTLPKWLSDERIFDEDTKVPDDDHPLISLCGSEERTNFEKDVDAIIHFSAFRRLAHKTQVMLNPQFDFPRTRLMHSIETMRIARQLAALSFKIMKITADDPDEKNLRKNFHDALCAVCLAHDIGHPPFGHEGERALNDILQEDCGIHEGFNANKQNIRVLCGFGIDEKEPFRQGLNLTAAVLDGLMKKKNDATFRLDSDIQTKVDNIINLRIVRNPLTYIMDAADDISNISCDCEDGLKLGLLKEPELTKQLNKGNFIGYDLNWKKIQGNDWKEVIDDCLKKDNYDRIKSSLIKGLIVHFCMVFESVIKDFDLNNKAVLVNELPTLLNNALNSPDYYPTNDENKHKELSNILFHGGKNKEMLSQSQFIYNLKTTIYNNGIFEQKEIKDGEYDARTIIYGLWDELKIIAEKPKSVWSLRIINLLPGHLKNLILEHPIFKNETAHKKEVRYRLIADHISGMTDRYAISAFKRLRGIKITI